MSWGDIGPYDFRYKPDHISAARWTCLRQMERNAIACRSPAWQEDVAREAGESERRRAGEIREFRSMFPLVDLDAVPRKGWMRWPGVRCSDGASLCPVPHNGPVCKLRHRAQLFTVQAGTCGWCGETLPANLERSDIDHVIPRSRRGPDERWNLQLLHSACNSAKSARLTEAAYDLADAHGFAIPDFVAVWEQPANLTDGRSGTSPARFYRKPVARWSPSSGPVHLAGPVERRQTLCGYGFAGGWMRADGEGGKPWNATCDRCRERRLELGPGTVPAYDWLPY